MSSFGLCALFLAQSPTAFGRFQFEDARSLDSEAALTPEAYIDKKSYEFPESLRARWIEASNGVRVTAGSLNADRFEFLEQVKLSTNSEGALNFAYLRNKWQDVVEPRVHQEFRLEWAPRKRPYTALLADGDSHKYVGDLGVAAGWGSPRRPYMEVYFFSVDHYFNTKNPNADSPGDSEDEYSRKPRTGGIRFAWGDLTGLWLRGRFEYDKPTTLWLRSEGRRYDYARRFAGIQLSYGSGGLHRLVSDTKIDEKHETLHLLKNADPEATGRLDRRVVRQDLYYVYPSIRGGHARSGFEVIARRADYEFTGISRERGENLQAPGQLSPEPDRNRNEAMAYHFHLWPLSPTEESFFRGGLLLSRVRIHEHGMGRDRYEPSTQAKLHTGYERRFGPRGSMFFGANWNLDRLVANYPYTEDEFRPWNGGNIQFQVVF